MTKAEKYAAMAANNEAIAANVPKVYKAGQSSMVDESKLISKTVSGSYISVDDVSEIPHSVACKVTGVDKPEEVKVTRCGKNLCPEEVESGYYWDSSGTPTGANASYVRVKPFAVSPLTTYTISSNLSVYRVWFFGKGTGIKSVTGSGLSKNRFTTPENCDELRMSFYNTSGAADTVAFEYAQVEIGETVTPHEPYNGQTFTPTTDGTVEGITSVSPYMNIFSDTEGVNIEATYNKSYGMQTEYDRFWDAYQWNGTRVDYHQAFGGKGWRKENFKPKYDVIPNGADYLFYWFNFDNRFPKVDLKEVFEARGIKLDFSQGTASFYRSFYRSRISRVGVIDLSNNTTTSFSQFFYGSQVEDIEKFVVSETQDFSTAFEQCANLKHIVIGGTIGKKVNFQYSPLTLESAKSVINALKDYSGTDKAGTNTVTFSSTTCTLLDEAGAIFNGMIWDVYIDSIGWTA